MTTPLDAQVPLLIISVVVSMGTWKVFNGRYSEISDVLLTPGSGIPRRIPCLSIPSALC